MRISPWDYVIAHSFFGAPLSTRTKMLAEGPLLLK